MLGIFILKIDEDEEETIYKNSKPYKTTPAKTSDVVFKYSHKQLVFMFIMFRLINCFLVQTWFAPDEFWQSQEVAHRLVFK